MSAPRLVAPVRLTAVMTHPVQYFAPWFRHIAAHEPAIDLTVIYGTTPTAERQGTGFARPITWGAALSEGFKHRVMRPGADLNVASDSFRGVDVPEIGDAINDTEPDAVLLMGWHSILQARAMRHCRRRGVPLIYRGDTNLEAAPRGARRVAWGGRTRWLLSNFDAALAVGRRARRYLLRFGVDPTRIWASPHCVDNAFFAAHADAFAGADGRTAARASFGLPADGRVLLFVGKLEDRKRPMDVIRAAARLGPPYAVLFAGDGADRETCRAVAESLGVRLVTAGFLPQSELARAYRAADCLVLPSSHETWGLVVNEALACGTPVVASDRCGCVDDLVHPGASGERFPPGDVAALAAAVERLAARTGEHTTIENTCRATVAPNNFAAATTGLLAACHAVAGHQWRARSPNAPELRVLSPCGGMAIQGGMERMTFEVLRVARLAGAHVHCIVNRWAVGNDPQQRHPIEVLADAVGATHTAGYYWYRLDRHTRSPWQIFLMVQDIARTSAGFLRDAWHVRPTHVVLPEHTVLLRNWPALLILRALGVKVILRMGNAPAPGRFYQRIWRTVISPSVDWFIGNSEYVVRELVAHGVPAAKTQCIPNHFYRLDAPDATIARDPGRVIFVGQLISDKGPDLLLDAIALLTAQGRDVRLDVVGDLDGWESPTQEGFRARLLARAAEPDLAGRVRFLGARSDVMRLMSAASLHCAPSRPDMLEGMPAVVIEAKHAALPTVAFALGPFPEMIVHRETGWLAADVAAAALAEGIAWFLDDPARRDAAGRAAQASAAMYSRELFERRILDVLGVHGSDAS